MIKINKYFSQEEKKRGGGVQGDKYISNYYEQFVQLVVITQMRHQPKLAFVCTFPSQQFTSEQEEMQVSLRQRPPFIHKPAL